VDKRKSWFHGKKPEVKKERHQNDDVGSLRRKEQYLGDDGRSKAVYSVKLSGSKGKNRRGKGSEKPK